MTFLPKIPYVHRVCMVLANPTHGAIVEIKNVECNNHETDTPKANKAWMLSRPLIVRAEPRIDLPVISCAEPRNVLPVTSRAEPCIVLPITSCTGSCIVCQLLHVLSLVLFCQILHVLSLVLSCQLFHVLGPVLFCRSFHVLGPVLFASHFMCWVLYCFANHFMCWILWHIADVTCYMLNERLWELAQLIIIIGKTIQEFVLFCWLYHVLSPTTHCWCDLLYA